MREGKPQERYYQACSDRTNFYPYITTFKRGRAQGENIHKYCFVLSTDYKGYIRLVCHEDCKVEFHPGCWKKQKSTQDGKAGDKVGPQAVELITQTS